MMRELTAAHGLWGRTFALHGAVVASVPSWAFASSTWNHDMRHLPSSFLKRCPSGTLRSPNEGGVKHIVL
jgi:hypothetical protein